MLFYLDIIKNMVLFAQVNIESERNKHKSISFIKCLIAQNYFLSFELIELSDYFNQTVYYIIH